MRQSRKEMKKNGCFFGIGEIIEIVSPSGLRTLTFEVTSNQKVQIPLYYLKILIFELMLRNM